MKSNRVILPVILLVIILVFVGVTELLHSNNSKEVAKQNTLTNTIAQDQKTLSQGQAELAAKKQEATTLQNELTDAQNMANQVTFRTSAESIEYDQSLFSIADTAKVQITSLTAAPPVETKENNATYQVTTFTLNVEGITPDTIFSKAADSTDYINSTVQNILAFLDKVATSSDFNTAIIPTTSITAPEPMTDADVATLRDTINGEVQAQLTQVEIQGLTADQIAALVQNNLAAMKPEQVQVLIEKAGIPKPSATVTINVWTNKGV
jgi:cell division protein FtsB